MPDAASKRAKRRAAAKAHKNELQQQEAEIAQRLQQQRPTEDKQSQVNAATVAQPEQPQPPHENGTSEAEPEVIDLTSNPYFAEFQNVFARFEASGVDKQVEDDEKASEQTTVAGDIDDEVPEDDTDTTPQISRKELKRQTRLTVAELKQLVKYPEVVELHDVNAADPTFLIELKSLVNSVPVPQHWGSRVRYLSRKRAMEKPQFQLPAFIAATGIGEARASAAEKESEKSLKQQQRSKMQVKVGRVEVDYQLLHDAFYKHQTKPQMTSFGELYHEGAESEAKVRNIKPGRLSSGLRAALGMQQDTDPPPYLFAMQRHGPPPAYPGLQLPGVNAPIPMGCRWGFGPGEWGKPPLDAAGRPLYGDVFGQNHLSQLQQQQEAELANDKPVDKTKHWAEISAVDEEEAEDGVTLPLDDEMDADDLKAGTATESGIQSTLSSATGLTTPAAVEVRKEQSGTESARPLYTTLEQRPTHINPNDRFGSSFTYVMPQPSASGSAATESDLQRRAEHHRAQRRGDLELTLNPEEVENLDAATIKRRYEAARDEARKKEESQRELAPEQIIGNEHKRPRKADRDSVKGYKF